MRKQNMKWLLLSLLLLMPNSGLFANAERAAAKPFSLNNLAGEQVALEDFRGKVVLVNFWATWCPPCVHELPSMQALKTGFGNQPFEILALNMGERNRDIQSFLDSFSTRLDFPILLNADHNVAKNWEVRAMPTSLIIDKTGGIAEVHIGPRDWDAADVRQQISLLLEE